MFEFDTSEDQVFNKKKTTASTSSSIWNITQWLSTTIPATYSYSPGKSKGRWSGSSGLNTITNMIPSHINKLTKQIYGGRWSSKKREGDYSGGGTLSSAWT